MMIDVDRAMAEDTAGPVAPEGWVCDSLEKAVWAAKKLVDLRRRMEDIDTSTDRAIEQYTAEVNDWANRRKGVLANDADFFSQQILGFHKGLQAANPKEKTLKLPGVVAAMRDLPGGYEHTDAVILNWVQSAGLLNYVKSTPKLDWTTLKKDLATTEDGDVVLASNGEVVPGVMVTEPRTTHTITINTGVVMSEQEVHG